MARCVYEEVQQAIGDRFLVNIEGKKKACMCKTCQRYMQQDKMPPMCTKNKLEIKCEPDLESLTPFENSLIAKKIPFMFIHQLPSSRMSGMKGKVTLVPIQDEDIMATVEAGLQLPRTPDEAQLVTYQLKKKLEYRQTVGRPELVNPHKLHRALKVLKSAGNPHYQLEFTSSGDYMMRVVEEDPKGSELVFPEVQQGAREQEDEAMDDPAGKEQEDDEERRYDARDDPVQRNQHVPGEGDTCMVDNNPEMSRRAEDSVVSVAPGEGRVPVGLLYSDHWDVEAFPKLHNADGGNGIFQADRPVKITDLQIIHQKMLNINRKFAENFAYLSAGLIYQEKKQIRSNMNMSFTSGRKVVQDSGKIKYEHHDAWNVLRGIKNTPRFWRDKKAEVIAMMDNFGPFHWFFTLSCADKRWSECIAAICRHFPDVENVVYVRKKGEPLVIKVKVREEPEEKLLEDYMQGLDDSKHEIIRKNVQTITRCFDRRVKSFIKNVVMGPGNPMHIVLYTYRVEFQKRGHAHVHGCLWMDIDAMEKSFPGLKAAFQSLRYSKPLMQAGASDDPKEQQVQALVSWIDSFISCSLYKARVGEVAMQRAKEVQVHGHTARCHKKGPDCGFLFPRFPSTRTILARPEKVDKDYKKGQVELGKVRKVLEDSEKMDRIKQRHPLSEEASEEEYVKMRDKRIRALLAEAKVDFKDYHLYLEMNKKGVQVVLQRDIEEININGYNIVWLEDWNGNIDIQPVTDFFGVITYVTEYAFKPEPSEFSVRKALEQVKDKDMETKMKVIAQAYQETREMGEAEATYKLLPDLAMTMSNVAKQWVCLSREEERTTRARKAQKADIDAGRQVFELEDVEGGWIEQWDMRSKYVRREEKFWNISFSHFARMMQTSSKNITDEEREVNDQEGEKEDSGAAALTKEEPWYGAFNRVMECSHLCCTGEPKEDCTEDCCRESAWPKRRRLSRRPRQVERLKEIPGMMKLSKPHVGEPAMMKKRRMPAVLRFYKHNKETSPVKFFLQELILFVPFSLLHNGDMEKVLQEPDDRIVLLYEKYRSHIKEVKSQVFPFLEDVTEERFYVEKVRKELDIEEVGMMMAAGKEGDNAAAMDAEAAENGEFVAVDPELLERGDEGRVAVGDYGRVIIPNKKEMAEKTRRMDGWQRKVVDRAVAYARGIKLARSRGAARPDPPFIKVHGAAGTGEKLQTIMCTAHCTLNIALCTVHCTLCSAVQ